MAIVFERVKGMDVMKALACTPSGWDFRRYGRLSTWCWSITIRPAIHIAQEELSRPRPTRRSRIPFLLLATLASVTENIRLGTAICLAPEHNPVVLAKVIATLDCLSEGRFILGVGVG